MTMEALYGFGVFVVGLAARFALAVMIVAVLSLPITLVLLAVRAAYRACLRAFGSADAAGYRWDARAYYAPGHTWLKWSGRDLRVGVDDLAQRLLVDTE
ncbi:MAG TPA: hypothetical protein VLV15_08725, partial [Dongiaceae bacterium]|nr:hypothetical protein [Dongiaceae bacterium]